MKQGTRNEFKGHNEVRERFKKYDAIRSQKDTSQTGTKPQTLNLKIKW